MPRNGLYNLPYVRGISDMIEIVMPVDKYGETYRVWLHPTTGEPAFSNAPRQWDGSIFPGISMSQVLADMTHTAPGADDYAIQNLTNVAPFGFVSQDEGNSALKLLSRLQTQRNWSHRGLLPRLGSNASSSIVSSGASVGFYTIGSGTTDVVAESTTCLNSMLTLDADHGPWYISMSLAQVGASATRCVFAGLTDQSAVVEEPATIGAADAITAVAGNAILWLYDTGADTDRWFVCGIGSGVVSSFSAVTSYSPALSTAQPETLGILIYSPDYTGTTVDAKFYHNGVLADSMTSVNAITTSIVPVIGIGNRSAGVARSVRVHSWKIFGGHV